MVKWFPSVENEFIPIVNDEDEIVGSAHYKEAHTKGLLHREAYTYIINSENQVLLQYRADNELWDHSSAGHFSKDETYMQGARREFEEELGIKLPLSDFKELAKVKRRTVKPEKNNYRFISIFLVKKDIPIGKIRIDTDELIEVKYFSKTELHQLMKTERMTGSSKLFIKKYIFPELK